MVFNENEFPCLSSTNPTAGENFASTNPTGSIESSIQVEPSPENSVQVEPSNVHKSDQQTIQDTPESESKTTTNQSVDSDEEQA